MDTLIVKLGAAGDVVRTTTLLRRLSGRVTWVTASKNRSLLDRLESTSAALRVMEWEDRSILTGERFDLAINLEDDPQTAGILRSIRTTRLFGAYENAEQRMSYTQDSSGWFDMSLISRHGRQKADELKFQNRFTYQDLVFSGLGWEFRGEPYLLPPTMMSALRGDVAIASEAGPVWPMKKWAEYGWLKNELESRGLTVNYLPVRPSLSEHLADVRGHRCLVSGDSLPMHLALGSGIPCVALFNCTSPWEIYDYGILTKLISPVLGQFFYKRQFDPNATAAISTRRRLERSPRSRRFEGERLIPMTSLEERIRNFSDKRILVIGDVMLDRFIWGNVSRISPEAPVPVVTVDKEEVYSGGAANVARNLVPFAREVHIAGQVGSDQEGEILLGIFSADGIDATGVLCNRRCQTITKTRVIARKQQVVRFDRERITRITSDQIVQVKRFVLGRCPELDGVILSDYGKGFITQELVDAVIPIARSAGLVITVDPNPNNPLKWDGITAIKPNRAEAFREVGVEEDQCQSYGDPRTDRMLLRVGKKLLERWGTKIVQITLGEQGMIVFEQGGISHHIPTVAREVFDVSGAGDTAIALFTLSLTAGASAIEAAEISNHASGIVVGKIGTATLIPQELIESMRQPSGVETVTSVP